MIIATRTIATASTHTLLADSSRQRHVAQGNA